MTLQEARQNIDRIDPEIRTLLMKRMDCSAQVAAAKIEAGSTDIYRADREAEILSRLGAEVPEARRPAYLAVVRKIMETSRMYQYGLLYDRNPDVFHSVSGSALLRGESNSVTMRLTRPDHPNAMSSILCMIGDYGYNMERMELIASDPVKHLVTFELTVLGNLAEDHMKKLMFQLSKESRDFQLLHIEHRESGNDTEAHRKE